MNNDTEVTADMTKEDKFYNYYAEQSMSDASVQRFEKIKADVLRMRAHCGGSANAMQVMDIGCGACTQAIMWAREGHFVCALDINIGLVELGRQRAAAEHLSLDARVGSATALPWDDDSMDICLVPELLEHVPEWSRCIDEFCRVLKPNGLLYLSTNNSLCPLQQEFNLPCYSWYPGWLKRRYEQLAVTTRPDLVNHAKYPAVNWFTFFGLRKALLQRGFIAMNRFDMMDISRSNLLVRGLIKSIRMIPPLRWLAHIFTPYTVVIAVKTK